MELLNGVDLLKITVGGVGLPVLLVFFTQAIKGFIPEKARPLIPMIVGILFAFLLFGLTVPAFFGGLALGILANGEYKLAKPPTK